MSEQFPVVIATYKHLKRNVFIITQAYCAELACFDYHRICKSGSNIDSTLTQSLLPSIQDLRKTHGFYVCINGHPSKKQAATIRTNCLDCLDRTNSVQGFLGRQVCVFEKTFTVKCTAFYVSFFFFSPERC